MGFRKQIPVGKQEMTPELWGLLEVCVRARFGDTLILNPKLNPRNKGEVVMTHKVGYWDETNPTKPPRCTVCGKRSHSAQYKDERKFCPHCGAEMKDALITK